VYEWDFDALVDSDGDGIATNDIDATGPIPTHVYGDDGNYTVILTVIDEQGLSDTDTCNITVLNVNPAVKIESATMDVEIGLRVAGRKYNDVGMTLYEDGNPIGNVSIERMPGSPNDQMAWIHVVLNMTKTYNATVTFTLGFTSNSRTEVWRRFIIPLTSNNPKKETATIGIM
jgi:PKD repeat protein